ncbi:uncharacterized protein LOC132198157 isoform X1 [Neocloeon triangulifer]|uniref:uncharacterized protein LOC132198157 isoform X1 n=1 Tax=Neocloeon triangulifer TaxID=2078957 RepID=UPI00286EC79A|nr:uncharacterized protein LOC132198157 isoform X1 [Neocloeon triangulifer]
MLAAFGKDNCVRALVDGQVSSDASPELKNFLNLEKIQVMAEMATCEVGVSETFEKVVESIDGLDKDKKASLLEFLQRAMPIVLTYSGLFRDALLECKNDEFSVCKLGVVGHSFYPRLKSVPVGCEVNAALCSHLKTFVLKALRPIDAGERIYFISPFHFRKPPKPQGKFSTRIGTGRATNANAGRATRIGLCRRTILSPMTSSRGIPSTKRADC